jgi:ABC-type Fe3+-hydroxamate transport system substrate-binding protein
MKRSLIALALLTLTLFTLACATTAQTQTVRGTISALEGNKLTVTPATGSPVTVTVGGVTRIWKDGVEAKSTNVLASGQNVQVFFDGERATKVVIAQ